MSISADTLIFRLPHSLGLKSLTIHRCRRFKCASTCHTPPHQLPFMERCVFIGEIRATASAEQEASTSTKLASSCAFGHTRSPFSFSGNTSPVARNSEREGALRRTNIELRVEIGFFQHVAQTIRRPVVDNAVSASHHFYAFVVQLFERHMQRAQSALSRR